MIERVHGREPRGNMAGPIRLRDLRTKAGLSQRTLAARVGVSAAYVAMVERGLTKASPQYVADVLQALDVKRPYRARVYWAFEMIPPSIIEHLRENRVFFNACFDAAEPYDGPLKYRSHDERDDPEDDPTDARALRQQDAPRADVQPGGETPVGGT